jgi:hypothetical protein
LEVFFGVYAYGVVVGGFDVDVDVVFEEAELFEAFGLFEGAGGEGGKTLEGGFAVGIEAQVLPVWGAGSVAVVRDRGSGEVEGSAVGGGDYFYGVWVVDVSGSATDFEGGDLDFRAGEGMEQGGEVFGFKEGFIALDVDVDIGVDELGDGVEAVGAAGEIG